MDRSFGLVFAAETFSVPLPSTLWILSLCGGGGGCARSGVPPRRSLLHTSGATPRVIGVLEMQRLIERRRQQNTRLSYHSVRDSFLKECWSILVFVAKCSAASGFSPQSGTTSAFSRKSCMEGFFHSLSQNSLQILNQFSLIF